MSKDNISNKLPPKNFWEQKAQELLMGKRIIGVKYMSTDEANESMWGNRPICILLNDGTWIIPQRDDEGNDGGSLYVSHPRNSGDDEILPVIGMED